MPAQLVWRLPLSGEIPVCGSGAGRGLPAKQVSPLTGHGLSRQSSWSHARDVLLEILPMLRLFLRPSVQVYRGWRSGVKLEWRGRRPPRVRGGRGCGAAPEAAVPLPPPSVHSRQSQGRGKGGPGGLRHTGGQRGGGGPHRHGP